MGGDAGGSIRIPSSYNGIFGIKPTQGRVPRRAFPVHNMISQGGPMTRYVEDSALMLEIISGFSSEDPSSMHKPPIQFEDEFWEYSVKEYFQKKHSKKQLNIAWIDNFGSVTPNTEIKSSCLNALSQLEKDGHTITPVQFGITWFCGIISDCIFCAISISPLSLICLIFCIAGVI